MRFSAVALGVALAGCAIDPLVTFAPAPDSDGGPFDTGIARGGPTYYGEVDDILAAHCWSCHSAAGGHIAFDLDSYEEARDYGGLIVQRTTAHTMPPFYAVNDGSCQTFEDHGRWLSDFEITVLSRWVERGAQEGVQGVDPVVTPPMHIDAPDLEIMLPAEFTPQRVGTSPNETRCFVVDAPIAAGGTDAFITSYEVVPGNSSVVHHVIVYEPETDAAATMASTFGPTAPDTRAGYPCNGGVLVPAHPVALWAPGAGRTDYPADTGLALPAGRKLIIQVHYNLANAQYLTDADGRNPHLAPDRTHVSFLTEATVPTPATMMLLSQSQLMLPPHDSSVLSDPETFTSPAAGRVWGLFPHMHTLGRHLELTLRHGGASSCMLEVHDWDFDWQQAYFYEHPLEVASGDVVSIQCEYDTRSADMTTTFGEGTENEMCLAFFYVTGP
jgi:hypothetical protein